MKPTIASREETRAESHQQLHLVPLQLLLLMRPKQWTKNLLLFAALIFSIREADSSMFLRCIEAFWLFCLLSGCVYILNDFVDRKADRLHPAKRHRPIASGSIRPYTALSAGFAITIVCFAAAFTLDARLAAALGAYLLLNIAYSFKLKHVVIFDMMSIAIGFVLRAVAGGIVIGVSLTPWFLLCILLLSLFLAINKRRHEVILLQNAGGSHRKVLKDYSQELLNQMSSIVTAATVICYSLFTVTSQHSEYLVMTVPVVLYGIFRYMYLIHMQQAGGSPERILLEDKHILGCVCLYAVLTASILFYFG